MRLHEEPEVPVLASEPIRRVSERIALIAYDEYVKRYGPNQSFERLHERGGFSVGELIDLLADAAERRPAGGA